MNKWITLFPLDLATRRPIKISIARPAHNPYVTVCYTNQHGIPAITVGPPHLVIRELRKVGYNIVSDSTSNRLEPVHG